MPCTKYLRSQPCTHIIHSLPSCRTTSAVVISVPHSCHSLCTRNPPKRSSISRSHLSSLPGMEWACSTCQSFHNSPPKHSPHSRNYPGFKCHICSSGPANLQSFPPLCRHPCYPCPPGPLKPFRHLHSHLCRSCLTKLRQLVCCPQSQAGEGGGGHRGMGGRRWVVRKVGWGKHRAMGGEEEEGRNHLEFAQVIFVTVPCCVAWCGIVWCCIVWCCILCCCFAWCCITLCCTVW